MILPIAVIPVAYYLHGGEWTRIMSVTRLLGVGRKQAKLDASKPTPFWLRGAQTQVLKSHKDNQVEHSLGRIEYIDHEGKKEPNSGRHSHLLSNPWHDRPHRGQQCCRDVQQTLDRGDSARFDRPPWLWCVHHGANRRRIGIISRVLLACLSNGK
jgi:hypothetical protein